MSTNRSNDRASLCSFTFAPMAASAALTAASAIPTSARSTSCSGGFSDPPARWPRAPVCHPEGSEGSAFCRGTSAKPSCKPCTSPSTNTSTPSAPIPGAKPSALPTNSLPITCRPIPNRRNPKRPRPQLPQRHRTHLPPPNRTRFMPY